MKSILTIAFILLNIFSYCILAVSVKGNRVLVLLDELTDRPLYSRFWQSLEKRQYELDFKQANDQSITLYYFGEPLYEHIIHFAPKNNELGKHPMLNNIGLIRYISDGGNLLVAVNEQASETVRSLANEFDIEFDPKGTKVLDKEEDGLILTQQIIAPTTIIDKNQLNEGKGNGILYRGVGLLPGKVPLLNRVLTSEKETVSGDRYQAKDASTVDLVASFQTRTSSRVTFSGSLAIFSDKLWDDTTSKNILNKNDNEDFIYQLTQWTFQEKSVLKIIDHRHHKEDSFESLEWYRIKDQVVYVIEISEYKDGKWVPYHADDIQLELIMLDPYIRTTLKEESTKDDQHHYGRFVSHLKLPDVYGVFTFKVNYKRAGLTYLLAEDVVAIRPFRHNEYPRFLTAAYPYYFSVGSMILGFLVFSIVWLSTWGNRNLSSTSSTSQKKSD